MRWSWSTEELVERWSLSSEERGPLPAKIDAGRLGFAAQLVFHRAYGRFPDDEADLAPAVIGHLAAEVGAAADALENYDWGGRTSRRHRRTILGMMAVRTFDGAAEAEFRRWFAEDALPDEPAPLALEERIGAWFARAKVTRPGAHRLDRIVRSVRAVHDDRAFRAVVDRLDDGTRCRLDALLADDGSGAAFSRLQSDPGRIGLEGLLAEIGKLDLVRSLELPADILRPFPPALVKRLRRRAVTEAPWELRRHSETIRLALLVFACASREAEIVDALVELLIQVTHRITTKAEKRVIEGLLADAVQVRGKAGILFKIAEAALDKPDGVVREVIFPVAGEQTFEKLVKEAAAGGGHRQARILPWSAPPTALTTDACCRSCWRRSSSARTTRPIARPSTRSRRSGPRPTGGGITTCPRSR